MGLNFSDPDPVDFNGGHLPSFIQEVALVSLEVFGFLFPRALDKILAVRLYGQRPSVVGLLQEGDSCGELCSWDRLSSCERPSCMALYCWVLGVGCANCCGSTPHTPPLPVSANLPSGAIGVKGVCLPLALVSMPNPIAFIWWRRCGPCSWGQAP